MADDTRYERRAFLLTPLDTLFCRDGRPFGVSAVAWGGLPQPQTVAGAFRTHVLRALDIQPATQPMSEWPSLVLGLRFRGPWLAQVTSNGTVEPLVGMPGDLMKRAKERGAPPMRALVASQSQEGWQIPGFPPRPLWIEADKNVQIEPLRGLLKLDGIQTYLRGGIPGANDIIPESSLHELYMFEPRVGIEVDAYRLSAAQSQIYSTRMLRMRGSTRLYVEVDVPPSGVRDAARVFPTGGSWTMPLGGEGRLVSVSPCSPVKWPEIAGRGSRSLLMLITPAYFPNAPVSMPPAISGWSLQAAAVPGYVPVSGWDLKQRCPKPTRNFVLPGSVYCFERTDPEAESLPGHLGDAGDMIGGHTQLVHQGYGLCLKGEWFHG